MSMNEKLRILVIGSGGREHALIWKIQQSPLVEKIFCAPGNAGTSKLATNVPIKANDINGLLKLAVENKIDLTVVGPEEPLVLGIVDLFKLNNLLIVGPDKASAQLEGSKAYAKEIMRAARVPTGRSKIFVDSEVALEYLLRFKSWPIVIKADGLAAGKGVKICQNLGEATLAVNEMMIEKKHGSAGDKILVEEYLGGEEVSYIALVCGRDILPLATSQDHKRAYDNDQGDNTGGMGAYSPAPIVTEELDRLITTKIVGPLIDHLADGGRPYFGFLYFGLMICDGQPYVLEFNVRLGDPETQPIMMRMQGDIVPLLYGCAEGNLWKYSKGVRWDPRPAVCVVMASKEYPDKPVTGYGISGLERIDTDDVIVFHAGTQEENGIVKTSGGRVLGVTAIDLNFKTAITSAYAAIMHVNWPGARYRTDIGGRARIRK